MGSRFGAPNKADPIWLEPLTKRRPACMGPIAWNAYLEGVRIEAIGDPSLRRLLERGWMPNYCAGCTNDYANQMLVENRCFPLNAKRLRRKKEAINA
jgi:hypothetical protein